MTDSDDIFQYEGIGNILVVRPMRDFMSVRDADLRDAYNETYRRLLQDDFRHLIFDLKQLNYFGSTFVGIMIRLAKKVGDGGGRTVLCHLNDATRGILKQLMLLENAHTESLWRRAETREIAVAWLESQNASET